MASRVRAWLALGFGSALVAGDVHAAGFSLVDQGGRGLGSAYAGEAAMAVDATTIAFNPAGLARVPGWQLVVVGHVLQLDVDFENHGSHVNPRLGDGPLHGAPEGGTHPLGLAPSLYLSAGLGRRWAVGLGVLAPFGFRTNYDGDWIGRYHALESDLKIVEVAPTVAVRLGDHLSVGAEVLVQYGHVRASSALDMGGICALNSAALGAVPDTCTTLGLPVQSVDGFVRATGDSWGVGSHLGVLYEIDVRTRIGLSYRSTVRHHFEGPARFDVPPRAAILQSTGALQATGSHVTIDLPEVVRLAAVHRLDADWTLLAGIAWTHWARFQSITFRFDNLAQPPLVQPEEWNDSFRYALGVERRLGPRWVAQLGTAYDETPVPDARRRTARIPDADRVWLTTGLGYRPTPALRLDVSYGHLFGLGTSIDNPDPVTGHVLRGNVSGSAELIGLQLTWGF